jgi:hypothetical protein
VPKPTEANTTEQATHDVDTEYVRARAATIYNIYTKERTVQQGTKTEAYVRSKLPTSTTCKLGRQGKDAYKDEVGNCTHTRCLYTTLNVKTLLTNNGWTSQKMYNTTKTQVQLQSDLAMPIKREAMACEIGGETWALQGPHGPHRSKH